MSKRGSADSRLHVWDIRGVPKYNQPKVNRPRGFKLRIPIAVVVVVVVVPATSLGHYLRLLATFAIEDRSRVLVPGGTTLSPRLALSLPGTVTSERSGSVLAALFVLSELVFQSRRPGLLLPRSYSRPVVVRE